MQWKEGQVFEKFSSGFFLAGQPLLKFYRAAWPCSLMQSNEGHASVLGLWDCLFLDLLELFHILFLDLFGPKSLCQEFGRENLGRLSEKGTTDDESLEAL